VRFQFTEPPKKDKKIGSGEMYYNNPRDLLSRLKLLGGSIMAGNDAVKEEFMQIAHTLNKLGILNNNQLNDLVKEYVMIQYNATITSFFL